MKPLHIALLIAAGALGGAVVMKVAVRPQPAAPAPVVVTTPQAAPQIIRVAPVNSCPPRKTATKKLASEKSEKDPACEKGAPAEKTAAAAPTPAAG